MVRKILLDTSPLVSFLSAGLEHHDWVVSQWKHFRPPLVTCEPVLAEAVFLLHREQQPTSDIFELIDRGVIRVGLSVEEERASLQVLMERYRKHPMSLADACLVRLAELYNDAEVFTFDSDFRIYRRFGNRVIPVRMPDGR